MHVLQVSGFLDPAGRPPHELLEAWPSLRDIAEATASSGVRVSVIQACAVAAEFSAGGVNYHFLPLGPAGASLAASAPFERLLARLEPDVLHLHGLGAPRDTLALARLAAGRPLLLQDHANPPPRAWRRLGWRRALALADGIAFCAAAQAEPFRRARLLAPRTHVFAIPESTSRFVPGDALQARRDTGLHGDPAILWVGHLDHNKDPLAVLEGVAAAARELPDLHLWCCYGTAPLMRAVERRLSSDSALAARVHLLGTVPHARIGQLMQAADLFVLGSHREGSGYSLIEALATGLTPVVSDIPSFRALTGDGTVGALWPCGDSKALCSAIIGLASRTRATARREVRAHFEAELSLVAVGRRWRAAYTRLLERGGPCAAQVAG